MSRIDEALRRAQRQNEGSGSGAVGVAPEGVPDEELFEAPWTLAPSASAAALRLPSGLARAASPATAAPAAPAATMTHREVAPTIHANLSEKVVATDGMSAGVVEQYRKLAAKLHQTQLERDLRTLMIISAVPGEGKTLTSINLALTLTRSYRRKVLLIDADLRKPSIQDAFGIGAVSGLHEAALGETPNWSPVPVFDIGDGLSVMPAGRPTADPMSVLTSARIRGILAEARRQYDWVLIDTAPLAVLPDAHVLRDAVDGAVLVIQAGHTSYESVERAIGLVGREHIIGTVLNGVEPQQMPTAFAYASYYGAR